MKEHTMKLLYFSINLYLICTCTASLSETAAPSEEAADSTAGDCAHTFQMEAVCEHAVRSISELQKDLGLPDHLYPQSNGTHDIPPAKKDGDFDVAEYMNVLDHTALEKNKTLDWVYSGNWGGGHPVIYLRSIDDEPFITVEDYQEALCSEGPCPNYIDQITPVGFYPQGYTQLAVLQVMAEQFYLFWHAAFNDYKIIYNQNTLEDALDEIEMEAAWGCGGFTAEDMERARNMDLEPVVTYNTTAGNVQVSTIVFTKWGGFYRKTLLFAANGTSVEYENLVPFEVCWTY